MSARSHKHRRRRTAGLALLALVLCTAACEAPAPEQESVPAEPPDVETCPPGHDAVAAATDTGSPTAEPDAAAADPTDEASAPPDVPEPGSEYDNPVYDLCIPKEGLDALNEDLYADIEADATLTVGGVTYELEVEYHGASGRKFPKKSIKLKFRDEQRYMGDPFGDGGAEDGYEDLILKAMWLDQSLIREALAFRLMKRLGGQAPKVGFANLFLNGEHWGLYAVVEKVDEDFLERRGHVGDGGLYKGVDQAAHLKPGSDIAKGFEKKEEKGEPWDELFDLIKLLQTTPLTEEAFTTQIDPVFPLDEWRRRMIWIAYTQNLDAFTQNYYLYHEPLPTGPKWVVLPWDSDIAFANHWKEDEPSFPIAEKHLLVGKNHFGKRYVKVDSLRHAYIDRFEEVLANELSAGAVAEVAQELYDRVADDLARDLERWDRSSTPEQELQEILDFIDMRPAYLLEKLEELRDNPNLPDPYINGI